MQEKLKFLLEKYSVNANTEALDETCVKADGAEIALLPWESERRFVELRKLVVDKRVGNMCTYRIGHTATKGSDIFAILKREAGVIEFTLNSKIKEIFAIAGENTLNAIAETENGCVCTVELACTLQAGERDIDKHEIITDNGIACDMVVDTQVPQSSIYLFGNKQETYTDVDAELYGCSAAQVAVIRNAFAVCKSEEQRKHNAAENAWLDKVIDAAKASLETLSNVKVGG